MDSHPRPPSGADELPLDVVPIEPEQTGQVVPSASGGQPSNSPPAFCMITFVLMVPLLLVYWASVVQATRIIAAPQFAEMPFDAREMIYLELILAWMVALTGIPAALTLFITRQRVGLWLGRLAILALFASVVLSFLNTFVFPQPFAGKHQGTGSILPFTAGLILRAGVGGWFVAAMSQYVGWLAQLEKEPDWEPEWMRRKRFSN